jgi:GT2 family glycosyltransferase
VNDDPDAALAYLHAGTVTHSFMASVLQVHMRHPGLQIWPIGSGPLAIPDSRNAAVARLLDSGLDWLWFADSDMGFSPAILSDMISLADPVTRPVITAPYVAVIDGEPDGMGGHRQLLHPSLYELDETSGLWQSWTFPLPVNRLLPVGGCGAGMLLIHRSALETVGRTCFDRIGAWGEDLSFCHRLAQAGIAVHVHTGLKPTHRKPIFLVAE